MEGAHSNAELLKSFWIFLGFEVEDGKFKRGEERIAGVSASITKLALVAGGAAIGVGAFVEKVSKGMAATAHFAELNQTSARSGQAWIDMGKAFGISQEATLDSLTTMNSRLAEAARHLGRGRLLFERFGLSAKDANGHIKSLDELMGDVADKMASVSAPERLLLARRFGLDPKMALLMSGGRGALEAQRARAEGMNPLSERQYQQAVELQKQWHTAEIVVGRLSQLLGAALFPAMSKVLDKFIAWGKSVNLTSKSQIVKFLNLFVDVVMKLWNGLSRIFDVGMRVVDWLDRFHIATGLATTAVALFLSYKFAKYLSDVWTAARKVTAAIRAMATAEGLANAKSMLLGGAFIGLLLIAEDLYQYFTGGKSWTRAMLNHHPLVLAAFYGLVAAFIAVKVAAGWAAISSAAAWVAALGPIGWAVAGVLALIALIIWKWDWFKKVGIAVGHAVSGVLHAMYDDTKRLIAWIERAAEAVKNFLAEWSGFNAVKSFLIKHNIVSTETGSKSAPAPAGSTRMADGSLRYQVTAMQPQWMADGSKQMVSKTSTITQHIDAPITINSNDPVGAGNEVKRHLDRVLRDANRNAQDAVYQ